MATEIPHDYLEYIRVRTSGSDVCDRWLRNRQYARRHRHSHDLRRHLGESVLHERVDFASDRRFAGRH